MRYRTVCPKQLEVSCRNKGNMLIFSASQNCWTQVTIARPHGLGSDTDLNRSAQDRLPSDGLAGVAIVAIAVDSARS